MGNGFICKEIFFIQDHEMGSRPCFLGILINQPNRKGALHSSIYVLFACLQV